MSTVPRVERVYVTARTKGIEITPHELRRTLLLALDLALDDIETYVAEHCGDPDPPASLRIEVSS